MPGNIVRLIFTGDNASVLRAQREMAVSSETTGKVIRGENDETIVSNEETSGSFARMRGSVGLLAGAIGLGALAYGIKDVIQGGEKWQAQQAQLQASLRATGNNSKATINQINASATALSTRGGYGTPAQIAAITQFIGLTGKVTTAQKLNVAATDLARSGLISYGSAVSDIAAAQNGASRGLQRYIGLVVPVTKYIFGWTAAMREANPVGYAHAVMLDHQATALEINNAILKKYGDSTATYNRTVAGMTSNLVNTLDNLITTIELKLLPTVEKLLRGLMSVVQWVIHNWPTISRVIRAAFSPLTFVIGKLLGVKSTLEIVGVAVAAFLAYSVGIRLYALATAGAAVASAGLAIAQLALISPTAALSVAFTALDAAMDANPIGVVVLAIAALVAAFILVYNHVAIFRNFINSVGTFIAQNWKTLLGIIALPFVGPIEFVVSKFNWLKSEAKKVLDWFSNAFHSVEHFLGIGGSVHSLAAARKTGLFSQAQLRTIERENHWGPSAPFTRSNAVRANDSLPGNAHQAGDVHHQPIVIKIGEKVVAQTTVHFAQKQVALSG